MPTIPNLKMVKYTLEIDQAYRNSLPNPYVYTNDQGRAETVEIIVREFGLPSELLFENIDDWYASLTRGANDWLNVRYTPGELGIYGSAQGSPGRYTWNVVAIIKSLP